MDLTTEINNITLNIRVAVIVKTKNGYVLEKSPNGYYFFTGGRIKINETSEEAAKREILEELGIEIGELNFKTVIENFYKLNGAKPFHEICFVYTTNDEIEIPNLQPNQIECSSADFKNLDIKPKILKEYIINNDNRAHVVFTD